MGTLGTVEGAILAVSPSAGMDCAIPYSLVRSRCLDVGAGRAQDMEQLTLMEDEQVIEACAPDAPQKPRAEGVRAVPGTGVRTTAIRLRAATRANCAPHVASLSRITKRGDIPNGVASRHCGATHASVGCRVTPTWTTRRAPRSTLKNATSARKPTSLRGKTSHAHTAAAW